MLLFDTAKNLIPLATEALSLAILWIGQHHPRHDHGGERDDEEQLTYLVQEFSHGPYFMKKTVAGQPQI